MLTHRGSIAVSALAVLLLACSGESPADDGSLPVSGGSRGSAPGVGGRPGSPPSQGGAGGSGGSAGIGGGPATFEEPGVEVSPAEPAETAAEREAIQTELASVDGLTTAELFERYPATFEPSPTYDLSTVTGLSTIQASNLALDENELGALETHGFVVSTRLQWPTFMYGYGTLYSEDLPLYVSADSILFAVHHSYDKILAAVEVGILRLELTTLLDGMRSRLASGGGSFATATVRADADVYLAVAGSLLGDATLPPVAGGDAMLIADLVDSIKTASGMQSVELFGVARDEDFSQFLPRGHYAGEFELESYFRAMMWLGRTDLRLLETQTDGTQKFRRRQLEAALVFHELVDAELQPSFQRIDRTIGAFVGEHDSMQLSELDSLLADLDVEGPEGLATLDDAVIAQAITDGGYGAQRIASHIMVNGAADGSTLPLSVSFTFLGQRYVLDSHVFSNVVYDRAGGGNIGRMMPNPLDVAFAALGNNQAAALLDGELSEYGYAPDLAKMRALADAHPPEYWQANLYNHWLGALRVLSPAADSDEGQPPVAKSELWGRRLLSTQLASWAELRHDTLLYVKQSYTSGNVCEFPDAYVDPYPELYTRIGDYAAFGAALTEDLALAPSARSELIARLREHFALVVEVTERLREMAEHELTGLPFTDEMMTFINQAVTLTRVCGGTFLENPGWYGQLFFDPMSSVEFDPTIADVHTQPFDLGGNPVGRVLHVGTGAARLMVVIGEGCTGPRAYAGLASSYFERITENFVRLTDEEWKETVYYEKSPAWLDDVVR